MARVFLENDAVDVRLQEQEIRELQDEWETATGRSITNPKDQAEVAQKANDVAAAKQALNDARRDLRQFMRDAADRYVKASHAQPSIPIVTPSSGISSSKVPPFLNVQQPSSMKIADPDKFSGDMSDYRRWKFEIQNVIAVRTNIDTDDRKIRYARSRMEGAGLQWYEMYSRKRVQLSAEPNPDGMEQTRRKDEYQDFLNRLDNTFQDPLEQQTYRNKVKRSTQGTMAFNNYAIHFLDLVNRANLHPDTQTNTFLESLNPWVLRAWKPVTMPDTYDELVSSIRIALQIDDTIKQAERNAKNRNSTNYGTSSRYGTSNISNSGYSKNSASKQVGAPSIDSSSPGPFLVNPEKPLYKLRVDRGLCTRCGMKGHD
ncbi:hypothetical protein SeLEV6574_g04969 [Synchytrium endobioticum]|uniref:Retrotransposon gag domain-containing protein n=1 Tax=Synchytrium endobioticum TaxID=286115 RepID=A0A507CWT2_9FUNG|nr:hypothetical protein SeLEV6574_g04969 [Synchytrium endobioticum]